VGLLGPEIESGVGEESAGFMDGYGEREEELEVWDEAIPAAPPPAPRGPPKPPIPYSPRGELPISAASERDRAGSMPNYNDAGGLETSLLSK